MKQHTLIFVVLFAMVFVYSCSQVEELAPELTEKELITVSIGSLSVKESNANNGKTSAIPSSVTYIDVIYGPYPENISDDHSQPTSRVIKSFEIADFPEDYAIELEKGQQYYIGIAAYSLRPPLTNSSPVYEIDSRVSSDQPIFTHGMKLDKDLFAYSEIFTATDGAVINAELKRISAQLKAQISVGVDLPPTAKKLQISVKDASLDWIGGIDFNLLDPGDISDEITTYFEADLSAGDGINSVFHILPLSDSGPEVSIVPLQVQVKLLDEFDNSIAEGNTALSVIASNKCYNFILNPNIADQSISIDVDESIEEKVDITLD